MKYYFFLISLLVLNSTFSQVSIKGFAPAYIGETIEAFKIQDYFSEKQEMIASAKVEEDATFTLYLETPITQKVILKCISFSDSDQKLIHYYHPFL